MHEWADDNSPCCCCSYCSSSFSSYLLCVGEWRGWWWRCDIAPSRREQPARAARWSGWSTARGTAGEKRSSLPIKEGASAHSQSSRSVDWVGGERWRRLLTALEDASHERRFAPSGLRPLFPSCCCECCCCCCTHRVSNTPLLLSPTFRSSTRHVERRRPDALAQMVGPTPSHSSQRGCGAECGIISCTSVTDFRSDVAVAACCRFPVHSPSCQVRLLADSACLPYGQNQFAPFRNEEFP